MKKDNERKKVFFTGRELEEMGLFNEASLRNQRVRARKGDLKGVLPFVNIGGCVKYRKDIVMKFIKQNSVGSLE